MISIYTVLDTVVREMGWNPGIRHGEEKITFREFKRIMIISEITTNDRKCKELWGTVRDLEIGRKVNQSDTLLIEMNALCRLLARKYDYYSMKLREVEV